MKDLIPFLSVVFRAIVRALVPALFDEARKSVRDTAEDSRPQPELKARLQNRVRATWGRTGTAGALALCVLLAAGCGTRTVYVSGNEPVRLRQPIKNAKVWVMDADGNPRASRMTIPEGWYALMVPDDDTAAETNEKPASPPVPLPPDESPEDAPRICVPFNLAAALP